MQSLYHLLLCFLTKKKTTVQANLVLALIMLEDQWFSIFGVLQNIPCWAATHKFLIQEVCERDREFAFLTSCKVVLLLLVLRPHFEKFLLEKAEG